MKKYSIKILSILALSSALLSSCALGYNERSRHRYDRDRDHRRDRDHDRDYDHGHYYNNYNK